MKKIILIGGGGHCHSVIDVIESTNEYQIIGIIDNDPKKNNILGYNYIGNDDDIVKYKNDTDEFLVTIGKIGECKKRNRLYNFLNDNSLPLATIISKNAYISKHAKIGKGTIVMHHAIVNANSDLGENCIVNSKALIEHGVVIGDHSHIATNSVVNGGVTIGENVFLGSNSTVNLDVMICNDAVIGSNSLVTKSIKQSGTYKGIPVE